MCSHAMIAEEALVTKIFLHADEVEKWFEILVLDEAPFKRVLPLLSLAIVLDNAENVKKLTHCTMLTMDTLSLISKHRNTASQWMYPRRCTQFRSGAPRGSLQLHASRVSVVRALVDVRLVERSRNRARLSR